MIKKKFRISIVDFLPEHGKHPVGTDVNGDTVHFGDIVEFSRNGGKFFISYRYGNILLKQPEVIALIGHPGYKDGNFSNVTKVKNTVAAGLDWLIIGYTDDPLYEKIKHVQGIELIDINPLSNETTNLQN